MPTLITHSMLGIVAGQAVAHTTMSPRFWMVSIFCSVIPDADVIGFALGIPYGNVFGHRGFFHSLSFALLLGVLVVLLFFPGVTVLSRPWWVLVAYFVVLSSSHGVLDAFTNGGMGIALLSPFDNTRYFFRLTPINVSPLSVSGFLSGYGIRVLASEFLWVWLPAIAVLLVLRLWLSPVFFPQV